MAFLATHRTIVDLEDDLLLKLMSYFAFSIPFFCFSVVIYAVTFTVYQMSIQVTRLVMVRQQP